MNVAGGLNYYDLLGVQAGASVQEIRHAHRRLAQQFHPDLHPVDQKAWAEEKMKRLNQAYTTLTDAAARNRYDATLRAQTSTMPRMTPSDEWWFKYAATYEAPRSARGRRWRSYLELAAWIIVPVLLAIAIALYVRATQIGQTLMPIIMLWIVVSLALILMALSRGR